ncbi:MAG: KH domain-containing protein [Acidimicrobiales bacterium]
MSDSPFQPPPFDEQVYGTSGDDELEDDELEGDEEDGELDDDLDEDELEDAEEDDEDDLDEGDLDEDDGPAVAGRREAGSGAHGNVAPGGAARAVLEHVARSIVDEPDAVAVDVSEGRSGAKLALHVDPSDMGRIIGKRGRVAQAIRVLVRAAAASEGTDASVDIVD